MRMLFCLMLFCPFTEKAGGAEEDVVVVESRYEPVDEKRQRTVPIKVYLTASSQPQLVVLFSHGLGGSRENNAFLGQHWARSGYACVFMQHAGSDEEIWKTARPAERLKALTAAASGRSSLDRFADVPFVIDQLELWNSQGGHPLHGKLDLDHIGMSGHSFGAVTTLAVAGRKLPFNRSFPDARIDAFLALSPSPGKGIEPSKAFGQLTKPILCMTGTEDSSPIDPSASPESRREVYEALPAGDKYQLVFDGGHHFSFSDSDGFRTRGRDPNHHTAIQQLSVRFWNAYLRDDSESKTWLQSKQPVADCRLKDSDVWQWK